MKFDVSGGSARSAAGDAQDTLVSKPAREQVRMAGGCASASEVGVAHNPTAEDDALGHGVHATDEGPESS